MPDRRQKDRRESSGFGNKKITVSLPVFILSFTVCFLVLVCVILCTYFSKINFEKGYNEGYTDCYQSIYGYPEDEEYNEYEFSEETDEINTDEPEYVEF